MYVDLEIILKSRSASAEVAEEADYNYQGTKTSLPSSAPIHFMSTEGCIGVADYGTIEDTFDNVAWIDSIDVTYDPETQQVTYDSTVTAIHSRQQREKSQAFTGISMCPEDTNGKISGPHIEVKCKMDASAGANIMPIYVFRKLCPAMFDSSGKALKKLDADWTTLTAYGGSKIRQFGVRISNASGTTRSGNFSFTL